MTMRSCALLEAPPGPHGEAAKSSTTPTTSVAAPNPWTVPVPVRISSTIPMPGVTETSLSVKVALSMLSAGEPAAPRVDWAGAADAVSELPNKTAAIAAAPMIPALADACPRPLKRSLWRWAGDSAWRPGAEVRALAGWCWALGFIVASSVALGRVPRMRQGSGGADRATAQFSGWGGPRFAGYLP